MAEYSKEWIIQNNDTRKPDFSIEKEFNKLKEGQSIGIICEGYGITSILNHKSTCYVFKDGNKIKFSKISEYKFKQKRKTISLRNLFLIIIGIWISMGVVLYLIPKSNEIGDMFGTVNTLFSGLALAGIIFTIHLQKKELKLQRKELRLTRDEFIEQNKTLVKQRFENSFYQLIGLHHEIIDKLNYTLPYSDTMEKRKVFSQAVKEIEEEIKKENTKIIPNNIQNELVNYKELIDTAYKKNIYLRKFNPFETQLSHYLRNLYHIFKYIYQDDTLSEKEKLFYSSIIRSQLSNDELFILYYNSLTEELGKPNFLWLIKEFNIMDNFNNSAIPDNIIEYFNKEINELQKPIKFTIDLYLRDYQD